MTTPDPLSYRLFVALEIPAGARAELAELVALGRQRFPREVRWTPPENIHLTLKFLGECDVGRVAEIRDRLDSVLTDPDSLSLAFGATGVFPNWRAPRVLWVGLRGQVAGLERRQQAVDTELAKAGFPPETRPFRPHLTLGRVREGVSPDAGAQIGAWLRRRPKFEQPFRAERIVLMRSELSRRGSTYTELAAWSVGRRQ